MSSWFRVGLSISFCDDSFPFFILFIYLFRLYAPAEDFSSLSNGGKFYHRQSIFDHFVSHESNDAEQQLGRVCAYGFLDLQVRLRFRLYFTVYVVTLWTWGKSFFALAT